MGDLIDVYGDKMISHLDVGGYTKPVTSVLSQLLLKACTDKQFVADEAQSVLFRMGTEFQAKDILSLLLPYASEHKNCKVRGKAGSILALVVNRTTESEWQENGTEALLKTAAILITDRAPDAREAARSILLRLQSIFYQQQDQVYLLETFSYLLLFRKTD